MDIDGVDILIEGAGTETLVMIHGWPDTHRLWDRQAEALKDRYRCVRFTLPGFDPAHERRAWTLDELTGFFRRVIEAVSPGAPVTLLLHDWGCLFGYEFYMRHPSLVSRIVGVDIGDTESLERSLRLHEKLAVLGYQSVLAAAWLIGPPLADRIARFMAAKLGCRSDPARIHAGQLYPYYMTWFAGAQAYRRKFGPFRPACPMLFIYGRRKPVMFHARSWAEALGRRPGSKVVEFDTGHWVMSHQPERFNQVVGDWLAAPAGAS